MTAATRYTPYADGAANDIYHLLFCDDPSAFKPAGDAADFAAIAADATEEARARALACRWLAAHGQSLPAKDLLGVIVEVALDDGLDTLAAFADGGARYINHSGAMSIFEGRNAALADAIDKLFAAAREVIARIGPWDKPRLAPPSRGHIRLTFLVTDGLYFGEAPMHVFQRDAMAGPVVAAATELLANIVDMTAKK